jgi:hypothetical protein
MLWKRRASVQPDASLINELYEIGTLKNYLPVQFRDFVNELGLYVQLQFLGGAGNLAAGTSKWSKTINVYLKKNEDWDVIHGEEWIPDYASKYEPGLWEKLVDPTLEVARWIGARRGVSQNMYAELLKAKEHLERFGDWPGLGLDTRN